MVSIKDIAAKCGVSIATVSKALNNHKDVSQATKVLVCNTAKELGYLPNIQARALKTNRTYNLGVLFTERAQSGLTHSYFASVLNSFKTQAEINGYDITFLSNRIGDIRLSFYEHCIARNLDGVALVCVDDFEDEEVRTLLESSVPTVTVDYRSENSPAILSDNYSGIKTLAEYVHSMGHRKIAYIYGEPSSVTDERVSSFKETLRSLNIEIRSDYLTQGKYHDPKSTERLAERLARLDDPPTCILLTDDFAALGAMNAFEKLGLSVPDDISIVGYDGIFLSQVLNPKLTTFRQDTERIGAEAAKRLIALIRKEITRDTKAFVISGHFLEGSSVKRL